MVHKKKPRGVTASEKVTIKEEPLVDEKPPISQREQRARIIVRNLPFKKLSEESVRSIFNAYGTVIDVNLLKKKDGNFVGCGFVEFDNRRAATMAVSKANGIIMNGRPIIVDWAVPKSAYVGKVQKTNEDIEVKDELDSEGDEEEEKPEIDDDSYDDSNDTKPIKSDSNDESDNFDDDDEFNEGEDDSDEKHDDEPKRIQSNDAEEGRTVFIKNVPFAATNDDIKSCVKPYGAFEYALVCIDKLTEHSKGTAFVKFKDKESADKCRQDSGKLMLMDQPLEVTVALTKTQLENEKKKKKMKERDSRNLYLVREGVILAGSPVAKTVSASDMAKRLQIEQWKTQILRNLNMFVSKTRLVVHNLPNDYDDQKLRSMVEKYSPPNAVVKESRVMQDRKKFDGTGNPLSKEVGFVSFSAHEDAISFLRKVNNNPSVFTAQRRPIVSFSIENRQILKLKEKRLEKSRAKVLGDTKPKNLEKMNRKQRRFLKRREKFIKKRKEGKKPEKATSTNDSPAKSAKNSKLGGKKAKKRKASKMETPSSSKAPKTVETTEFSGVESVPGKKVKMRSRLKLKKQAEIHKERLKEVKKLKKLQKATAEKKRRIREKEPGVKKRKKVEEDVKFTKLIDSYKKKIESAGDFKKWYE